MLTSESPNFVHGVTLKIGEEVKTGTLSRSWFQDNKRAAILFDTPNIGGYQSLSINLPEYWETPVPERGTFIPDGNGLGGVADSLAALGLVKILETGVRYGTFDATATLVEITFPGMEVGE